MAAVIHIRENSETEPTTVAAGSGSGSGSGRPDLRVLDGGRSEGARAMQRVYLLRRLVAVTAVVLLMAAAVQVVGVAFNRDGSAVALRASSGAASTVHVVQSGDTLWGIAEGLDPSGDPRVMVQRVLELNASQRELGATGQLRIGQELNVPVSTR